MTHSFTGDADRDRLADGDRGGPPDEYRGGLADELLDAPDAEPAPPAGLSQRTIALFTAGGLMLLLVISLGVAALVGSIDGTDKPAAIQQPAGPVVPETSPSPTATAASAPATDAASPTPSGATTTARPSATKTTPAGPRTSAAGGARVVSASISISPDSYDGPCTAAVVAHASIRITISAPNVPVRYNVNGGMSGRSTPSGTTVTDDMLLPVPNPHSGVRTFKLNVELPSTASASATFEINCRNR